MNIYRTEFFAFCPVNGVRVKYHLSIETTETIRVEQIIDEVTMHQKGFHEEIADDLLRSFGGRQTLIAEHHGVQIETQRAVAAAGRFVRLADSDWVNIVNHPDVLDRPDRDTELAVSCAVRLTEGRLQELNTAGVAASAEANMEQDAVAALTEDGWTWDGDQWQRPAQKVVAMFAAREVMHGIQFGRQAHRAGKPREAMENESQRVGWDEAAAGVSVDAGKTDRGQTLMDSGQARQEDNRG